MRTQLRGGGDIVRGESQEVVPDGVELFLTVALEDGGDGGGAVGIDEAGHHGSGAQELGITQVLPVVFRAESIGDVVEVDGGGI